MQDIIDKLSPLERKIIPLIDLSVKEIGKKTGLDEVSILRGLRFLENKKIIEIKTKRTEIVDLSVNGTFYKKNNLPERNLLIFLDKHKRPSLEEASKNSGLSENEFKAALGALKKKAIIELAENKIALKSSKEEIMKKFPEELLIESLPKNKDNLTPEERYALDNLKTRKNIIEIIEKKEIEIIPTELGRKISSQDLKYDLIEEITPEIIKENSRSVKFRRYDIKTQVPKIYGGRTHFTNRAREYVRRVWLDMGFKEMEGPMIDSSFWVFDALFTPQDHPVREMQDSFYISKKEMSLPKKELINKIKSAHENGVSGSTGWKYAWKEDEAKRAVMRTHTTSLSARTLASLKKEDLPAKLFSVEKAFRNETIDWSHGIEFYQTEGIVIAEGLTLRHLLGYLKEFYSKMGFENIRFRPSFFPYTEPSVEIDVYNKEKGKWVELGGAGIFRPEVTEPLLGFSVPVIAWGQGVDRIIMEAYEIKDLREMYSNDLSILRNKKILKT